MLSYVIVSDRTDYSVITVYHKVLLVKRAVSVINIEIIICSPCVNFTDCMIALMKASGTGSS